MKVDLFTMTDKLTDQDKLDFLGKITEHTVKIITELLRAATANPLLGLLSGLIIVDVLERSGVIFKETGFLFKGIIVSAAGVELGSEIISIITSILPFSPPRNPTPELFRPSAQTIVYGNGEGSDPQLAQLITLLKQQVNKT